MPTTPPIANPSAFHAIFVARQPIFDRDQHVWGYELLFRQAQGDQIARIDDPDAATARVIADGFALGSQGLAPEQKILINFPARLLLSRSALALPSSICIPEILETVQPEPAVLKACAGLKKEGYQLALDDFVGQPGYEALLALADIVKVDVLGMEPATIIALSRALLRSKAVLLAEKVENKEVHDLCRACGFQLFQGFYFSKPQVIPGRTLSTGNMAKLQLLGQLARDDYDVGRVAQTVTQDPSLSFRLLRHLNSAAFHLARKVDSIPQAVAFLGGRALRQWLLVATLSDMGDSDRGQELFYSSVLRGRFLATCSHRMPRPALSEDGFFLLGVFSQLDALLGQPMDEILPALGLSDVLEQALLCTGGPAAKALDLAKALSIGDFDTAARLLLYLGLPPEETAALHAQASLWARALLDAGDGA
ncbi:EAL and HDOD domain-containing protein [Megalodesulfovibrio gigas]|uniref:Putative diguanylate phosphodiesterase n=1 Tax=Megalodesulfovibrio gigas (strain ATCC 19364 / DSM 1382 / NCIMB 9332 / VKM B-1759) TaxID=1121448 RepID=T2G8Z4_MEGG1|nr:HDOD domain-containing protein [Megalodesulfovibrio gigas]AGW12581.1 putative diguanylate phosphodiesterase [Megalodesulfovibrio gigas DSM 1382 = ATCC 19364]